MPHIYSGRGRQTEGLVMMDSRELFASSHSFRPHIASFSYPHNWCKSAVLLALDKHSGGLTSARIGELSGWPLNSIRRTLSRWVHYSHPYILRRLVWRSKGRHLVYSYRLSARGKRFLELRLPSDVREELEAGLRCLRGPTPDAAIAPARARLAERLRQGRKGAQ
jgi:hypothetical protein